MAFQSSVNINMGFGVVGDLFLADGGVRGQPALLSSGDAANNVVGRAFTTSNGADSSGEAITVTAGGTGAFAGILANSKVYASYGTSAGGTLAPTLTLPNGTIGELVNATAGIIVTLGAAANVGDWIEFAQATGILYPLAAGGTVTTGRAIIDSARVERYDITSGLAVISLGMVNSITLPA